MPLPAGSRDNAVYFRFLPITLDHGSVPGINTLEIVIENRITGDDPSNVMGLCAKFHGTALPTAGKDVK